MSDEILSINAAIDGEIENGTLDPVEIAEAILGKYSEDWLRDALFQEARSIIRERAERRHGAKRRGSAGNRTGTRRTDKYGAQEFFDAAVYVPDVGWKKNGELTHSDCVAVAGAYRQRASENEMWSQRYQFFASMIKKQKVAVLGDVSGIESIEEIAA